MVSVLKNELGSIEVVDGLQLLATPLLLQLEFCPLKTRRSGPELEQNCPTMNRCLFNDMVIASWSHGAS